VFGERERGGGRRENESQEGERITDRRGERSGTR